MPSKLIALHGETKLITPRRLDTSSASPQWIMITAGTASLTTGERWHQIGLQWEETWDAQKGEKAKQTIHCAEQTTLMAILDLGSANCHDSSLLTRPARLLQTLQFMHASFETYFFPSILFFLKSVWTFLFLCFYVYLYGMDAGSKQSCPFISLHVSPPTVLLFFVISFKD